MVFTQRPFAHTFLAWRRGLALVQSLVVRCRSLRLGRCRKNLPLGVTDQMDVDHYCSAVLNEIDEKLPSFAGADRLARLRSYYFTWRLPQYPDSDSLHDYICRIVDAREHLHKPYDMSQLQGLFTVSVPDADLTILEHCRRHFVILREIQRELAAR